jgi:hypothetical protein
VTLCTHVAEFQAMPYSIHIFLNKFFSTSQISVQKTSASFCWVSITYRAGFAWREILSFLWILISIVVEEVATFFKPLGVCHPISYAFMFLLPCHCRYLKGLLYQHIRVQKLICRGGRRSGYLVGTSAIQ